MKQSKRRYRTTFTVLLKSPLTLHVQDQPIKTLRKNYINVFIVTSLPDNNCFVSSCKQLLSSIYYTHTHTHTKQQYQMINMWHHGRQITSHLSRLSRKPSALIDHNSPFTHSLPLPSKCNCCCFLSSPKSIRSFLMRCTISSVATSVSDTRNSSSKSTRQATATLTEFSAASISVCSSWWVVHS